MIESLFALLLFTLNWAPMRGLLHLLTPLSGGLTWPDVQLQQLNISIQILWSSGCFVVVRVPDRPPVRRCVRFGVTWANSKPANRSTCLPARGASVAWQRYNGVITTWFCSYKTEKETNLPQAAQASTSTYELLVSRLKISDLHLDKTTRILRAIDHWNETNRSVKSYIYYDHTGILLLLPH